MHTTSAFSVQRSAFSVLLLAFSLSPSAHAQIPTTTTTAVTANKTTGALAGPVDAATFKSANSIPSGSGTLTGNATVTGGDLTVALPGETTITSATIAPTIGRTITAGTGITVGNGDGVSGNPTITLANTTVTAALYGSATAAPQITIDAQGRITAAGNITITPALGSITGAGTGVLAALGVNVGTAGAVVVNGGALGTPASGTLTNATGLPISTGISGLGTGVATALAAAPNATGGVVTFGGNIGAAAGTSINLTGGGTFGGNLTVSGTGGITASDLTLGTAGPSVKSSLAARAPRQGLVFDGTAVQASIVNQSAIGTDDFSVAVSLMQRTAAAVYVLDTATTANGLLYLSATGEVIWWSGGAAKATSPAGTVTLGVYDNYVVTRTGGTTTIYKNGVSVASGADSASIATALSVLSKSTAPLTGEIRELYIGNFAMSTTEITALFRNGVPGATRYIGVGTTATIAEAFTAGVADGWVLANSATLTEEAVDVHAGTKAQKIVGGANDGMETAASTVGQVISGGKVRIRGYFKSPAGTAALRVRLSGSTGGAGVGYVDLAAATYAAYTLVDTALTLDAGCNGKVIITALAASATWLIDALTVRAETLTCAPAAMEPGVGYQWHDTSRTVGPYADITLPTSGVSWALPGGSRNYVRGTLTWAGTHEPKSVLGQRAFPAGTVMDDITFITTASTAGAGVSFGTTTTAGKWVAANSATLNVKEVATLAARLPTDATANQHDLIADPDDQNFTGSVTVEAHYKVTSGTP